MHLLSYPKGVIKNLKIYFLLLFTPLAFLNAEADFTSGVTAETLAANIQGDGIFITNPTLRTHNANQAGTFTNGIAGAGLQIDSGIVLTTGSTAQAFQSNSATNSSVQYRRTTNPDPDLQGILGAFRAYDTVVFEFDVTVCKCSPSLFCFCPFVMTGVIVKA